jgi:uncharacterized protein (DUF2147 family)
MIKTGIVALAAGMTFAGAAWAADVAGLWRAPDGREVRIERCGESVCGHTAASPQLTADPASLDVKNKNPALRTRPLKGLLVMQGFQAAGDGWVGGSLYDPKSGLTYKGSLDPVGPDRLKVTGCIMLPMCGTQMLSRVK